jgi:hypothetical protein
MEYIDKNLKAACGCDKGMSRKHCYLTANQIGLSGGQKEGTSSLFLPSQPATTVMYDTQCTDDVIRHEWCIVTKFATPQCWQSKWDHDFKS